jgi:RHS repeat-associated protein
LVGIRSLVNGTETSRRQFLWCDEELCVERDGSGIVSKRFFKQGVRFETGPSAGSYFYTRDHLGSIREMTDSSGTVRARYTYDPFGRRSHLAGDLDADFGLAGMFWTAEARLCLTRFRAYDPELGRWLSRDPIRNAEVQEGANLYAYAGNDPVNVADPLGLCCEKERRHANDLSRLLQNICANARVTANLYCQGHKDWPDKFTQTCAQVQQEANKECQEALEKYNETLNDAWAAYYACLARPCHKADTCPRVDFRQQQFQQFLNMAFGN